MIDYRVGDTRDLCAELPDGSVDLIASSPPFLALRSYLPAGHESKYAEIGSESDPATFLDTLLELSAEWGRVLAPHGSIAIELGDTYSGSAGSMYDARPERVGTAYAGRCHLATGTRSGPGWPKAKSLALIPQLYAIALAYGINPLTGQPSPAGRWLVRNVIVWHRPNPAVGALGDKYRPSTSYIVVATRNPKRWFDLTAVRTEPLAGWLERTATSGTKGPNMDRADRGIGNLGVHPAGAPPLDTWTDHETWTITTQPSRLTHYAMWPPRLAERLILSMCPREVCVECGEPRRRIEDREPIAGGVRSDGLVPPTRYRSGGTAALGHDRTFSVNIETLGWSDCGHDLWRPGKVLDPFAGTGTTLCVADLHHRDSLGFDLDPRNRDLLDPRMAECRRALFDVKPEMAGQTSLFGGEL